jgi:anti-sigma regulatory factor (Ser/Thr protein kinase)
MTLADRVSLKPTASEVSRFNTWFDARCTASGIGTTLAADLKLCINEVLANAISYGFADTTDPWIKVRITLDPKRASATIVDNGTYFDLRTWEVPKDRDLKTAEPGGFGIALIKERARQIGYWRLCGRNYLKIVCLAAAPEA